MTLLKLPFFTALEAAERVLLAGAGGGYDVFCGLPLYFGLRNAGKEVHLANLSFSHLGLVEEITPAMRRVTADSDGSKYYFPERHLCQWFREQGEEVAIYCFERTGVVPIRTGYEWLVRELGIDTVLLVDGGTDSLMRGDECGLGTPHEDIVSIAAVDELNVGRKLLACLGFGIDQYHGVCHAHVLEGVAELSRAGGYLGTFSLLPGMSEAERYCQATRYVFEAMSNHISIVFSSSILSALEGHYGDHHATDRTAGSKLWINPLMTLYWCFDLGAVAHRIRYLDALKHTHTYIDVDNVIEHFRAGCNEVRPWEDIPL
jgi:hypothetical protein